MVVAVEIRKICLVDDWARVEWLPSSLLAST